MARLTMSAPKTIVLEAPGGVEANVDLFAIRLWSDEAGKRLKDFGSKYFDEFRQYLLEQYPSLQAAALSTGQLVELHNLVHDATEELLESQKKRNTQFVASLTGTEALTPANGHGNGSKSGTTTSSESLPSDSGTFRT